MTSAPQWMPLYIGDYLRGTRKFTTLEHGAYFLLIMHYWETGPLPDDQEELARIAGIKDQREWRQIWRTLKTKFYYVCQKSPLAGQLPETAWHHQRIDKELEKAKAISKQRALAGLKGNMVSRGLIQSSIQSNGHLPGKRGVQPHKYIHTDSSERVAAPQQEGATEEASKDAPRGDVASPELARIIERKARGGYG